MVILYIASRVYLIYNYDKIKKNHVHWFRKEIMGKIIYTKLLNMLDSHGLTTYKIRKEKIISESTLQNIRNGKRITTDSIAALCEALNCQPGDLLEYVPDAETPERDSND